MDSTNRLAQGSSWALLDRQGNPIEALYFPCACDLDSPCTVAECQRWRELEAADQMKVYRGAVQAGLVGAA